MNLEEHETIKVTPTSVIKYTRLPSTQTVKNKAAKRYFFSRYTVTRLRTGSNPDPGVVTHKNAEVTSCVLLRQEVKDCGVNEAIRRERLRCVAKFKAELKRKACRDA